MSDSVRPHRRQPIRLPRPWDSPGKNTGVGCHFLLQRMKVKSESESEVVSDLATPRTAAYLYITPIPSPPLLLLSILILCSGAGSSIMLVTCKLPVAIKSQAINIQIKIKHLFQKIGKLFSKLIFQLI